MPRTTLLSLSLSACTIAAASPAFGLTADELWTQWQAQAGATGQVMTAEQVSPGDGTLTLTGFSTTFSDGEVSTVGRIDEIVMTEASDGSVSVELSDAYEFTITFVPDPGTPPVNLGVVLRMPDLTMVASGTPGALIYDYAAPQITIEDGPISGGDGDLPTIDASIAIDDFTARYQIDGTDPDNLGYDTTSSFGSMAGAVHILPPPGEEGQMKLVLASGAMTATGAGQLGNLAELAADPEKTPTGFDLNAAFDYDSLNVEFTFEHPRDGFTLLASNEGGALSTSFSEAELAYGVSARNSATRVEGAELPAPVEFSVASSEIAFRVPLAATGTAEPVSARVAYEDVILGPGLWAMADPAGTFPRDPLTVIADLSGSMRVLENLMAAGMEDMDGPPPVELEQMTLNELRISAAGATLTGSGSAEFAPGPIPMPVGRVDLQLAGGMALLDTLQDAGLVPVEQLAMVRGMLGAFARPGATPDTLESTIEFTEGGGITANGVPLQ